MSAWWAVAAIGLGLGLGLALLLGLFAAFAAGFCAGLWAALAVWGRLEDRAAGEISRRVAAETARIAARTRQQAAWCAQRMLARRGYGPPSGDEEADRQAIERVLGKTWAETERR